ncbi:hypothetical protein GEV33_006783 [Tenebrio molitor]|uniref:Uncharacterized protein n=1 Tax=Tenebrio molitor TaxID=7067 RepID=A0A8J6LDQ1_TENMO|nr:hypothetical protein GEV33_006783 [Tenebrio molitor]
MVLVREEEKDLQRERSVPTESEARIVDKRLSSGYSCQKFGYLQKDCGDNPVKASITTKYLTDFARIKDRGVDGKHWIAEVVLYTFYEKNLMALLDINVVGDLNANHPSASSRKRNAKGKRTFDFAEYRDVVIMEYDELTHIEGRGTPQRKFGNIDD